MSCQQLGAFLNRRASERQFEVLIIFSSASILEEGSENAFFRKKV